MKMRRRELPSVDALHPGKVLRQDYFPHCGLNVTQLAAHLGVGRVGLSKFMHEHQACSPDLAVRLGRAFGTGAMMWMQLQMNYDLALVARRPHPDVKPLVPRTRHQS